jgi:complex iron-sulfur molybdoenzyme family reductase subunit gamma
MNLLTLCLASALHLANATPAATPAERYLAADGVLVTAAAAVPTTADDVVWDKVPATLVPLAPQAAITLNDHDAHARRSDPAPGVIVVRAVAGKTELAVLLEWNDATEDRFTGETDSFADSAALEVPLAFGAGKRLPYIGMGDASAPVLLHMVRATAHGPPQTRDVVAAGFGSGVRAPAVTWMKSAIVYRAKHEAWRALFVRPLVTKEHSIDAGLVPMAFAVWDGARDQRGGHKLLSPWRVLRLPERAIDPAYVDDLAFGYHDGDIGDASRGKGFVEAVCVSCHRIGDKAFAPVDLAPDLTNVGVLSTYGYLRDSMLTPSLVLVPNLNANRHQNRGAPPDAHGAWPNATLGAFAVPDASGQPQSMMPAFANLPREQLADVLAYLKTLGRSSTSPTPAGATP